MRSTVVVRLKIRYYNSKMSRALGFRAEPRQIYWAIVEGTRPAPRLIAHDTAAAPVNLDEAAALSWYTNRIKLIIEQYKPAVAMIRTAESVARGGNKEGPRRRLRLEGVLLQTADSCGLKVGIGALAAISGRLGSQAKRYIDSGEFRGLNLSEIPVPSKEAILVAVAALPES
jgi:hypothetical protein